MRANNRTQAVRLRLCGKLFCFLWGYEVIFIDTRVCKAAHEQIVRKLTEELNRA